jgi:hypothetical protein
VLVKSGAKNKPDLLIPLLEGNVCDRPCVLMFVKVMFVKVTFVKVMFVKVMFAKVMFVKVMFVKVMFAKVSLREQYHVD